ncbi:hypothetical protein PMAYCL1PPCAC_31953, partial [Pristionchus mayeri]
LDGHVLQLVVAHSEDPVLLVELVHSLGGSVHQFDYGIACEAPLSSSSATAELDWSLILRSNGLDRRLGLEGNGCLLGRRNQLRLLED